MNTLKNNSKLTTLASIFIIISLTISACGEQENTSTQKLSNKTANLVENQQIANKEPPKPTYPGGGR